MIRGDAAPRRIVGNLDCESDFAREAAAAEGQALPQGPLSRRVLTTIAGAATLLRVFARPGDRLWLPTALPSDTMCPVDGLPQLEIDHGPISDLAPNKALLAWGETRAVAGKRNQSRQRTDHSTTRVAAPTTLSDLLWSLPPAPAAAVSRINNRGFCDALTTKLGCRLAGSRRVTSRRELEAHLRAGGADGSTDGSWVLKARFSAAGRWRYIQRPNSRFESTRVDRLFNRHGQLLFEPWMERVADVGCCAVLTPLGLTRIGCHRLLVDSVGHFRGIEIQVDSDSWGRPWLDSAESAEFERVLKGVGQALQQEGYVGPFGIDAWRYRSNSGQTAFHPLGEINGRMTFGLVAWALVERLQFFRQRETRVRLLFRRQLPSDPQQGSDLLETIPLFQAPQPTQQAIWLEIRSPQP